MRKVVVREALYVVCDRRCRCAVLFPQFLNDTEQAALLAVRDRAHCPPQDGETLAVPRGNAGKESQNIYRKAFRVLGAAHDDIRVQHAAVALVRGQVYNVDLVRDLREVTLPVPALRFRVYDERPRAVQHRVIHQQVIGKALAASKRTEKRRRQRVRDRAFHTLACKCRLQVDVPARVHSVADIDAVLFPEHLRRAEAETGKEIARHVLDIVVHIPAACRDKLVVQADHIAHRAHQLDVHIVVEIPYRIAPALEFFLVRRGDAHHIGQLVHGFLALPQLGFQLIHAVQCFRNRCAGLVPALPRMIVQIL